MVGGGAEIPFYCILGGVSKTHLDLCLYWLGIGVMREILSKKNNGASGERGVVK